MAAKQCGKSSEAEMSTGNVPLTRGGKQCEAGCDHSAKWKSCVHDVKKKGSAVDPYAVCTANVGQKESAIKLTARTLPAPMRLVESASGKEGNRFRVVLLTEGLGNKVDGYYYTKEALKSAPEIFEGKKIYANHPDLIEEKVLPERDVKDILGHFENVRVEPVKEAGDGRSQLVADVVVLPGDPYDWARALMSHAVAYSEKYPDKEFVGLSINANGYNVPMSMQSFIESGDIPAGAMAKLKEAQQEGLEEVKAVSRFKEAKSCDLVTEAGAGGKILKMLEQEKTRMAKQGDGKAAAGGHDDAAADKELIKSELKKHLGDGATDEEAEAAMEAYQVHKSGGMSHEEAAKHGASSFKCAKHLAEKHKESEAEGGGAIPGVKAPGKAKESEAEAEAESEAKKEAEKDVKESIRDLRKDMSLMQSENIRLKGELAGMKESEAKRGLEDHIDDVLGKSKLPRQVTKTFRESVKDAKNKQEVDRLLSVFTEGYKTRGAAGSAFPITPAKGETKTGGSEGSGGLSDCV